MRRGFWMVVAGIALGAPSSLAWAAGTAPVAVRAGTSAATLLPTAPKPPAPAPSHAVVPASSITIHAAPPSTSGPRPSVRPSLPLSGAPRPAFVPSDPAFHATQKQAVLGQIAEARSSVSGKGAAAIEPIIQQALTRMSAPAYGLPISVNAAGERVVRVYHGGSIAEDRPFEVGASRDWSGPRGVYFTTDRRLAEDYAGRSSSSSQAGRVIELEIPASHFAPGGPRTRLDAFTATKPGTKLDGSAAPAPEKAASRWVQAVGKVLGLVKPATTPTNDESVMDLVLSSYDGTSAGQWGVFTSADYVNGLRRTTVKTVTQEDWLRTRRD